MTDGRIPSGTRWRMPVLDDSDPVIIMEALLARAVDRPQLFAAIRNRMAQGRGPSYAVLAGLLHESGTDGIFDTLQVFSGSVSKLLKQYYGKAAAQLSNRPGIFRFESILRMRRMLMTNLETLKIQKRPDIMFMVRQLEEIESALSASMMDGVPAGFGLRRLLEDLRIAADEFSQTRYGRGYRGLDLLKRCIDNLQGVYPLEDPQPEPLPDDFVKETFFQDGGERSVRKALLLDIIQHSDRLLRNPVTILRRAVETEWNRIDTYLLSQFSHRYNRYGERYMPKPLKKMKAANMDLVGAMEYDDSWKSYQIMWEMLRALGRRGDKARAMLPGMALRSEFLIGVLSSYVAMLKRGIPLYSGKGRETESLKDMPELEELMVLTETRQAIGPEVVAGHARRQLRSWLKDADMNPADRGYAIWRLKGILPSDDIEYLARSFKQGDIEPYMPQASVDPNDCSLSDYIRIKRVGSEFRGLVSTIRDLKSTPEESALAIEQIGLRGGKAAAGLLREIVLSAPPQLVPRDDVPKTVDPPEDFMGNTAYWQAVAPAAIEAMGRLGLDIPQSIVSTASSTRTMTLVFDAQKLGLQT